jgi:hypothetical protein
MGNKVPISDKQVDALSFVNFEASDFGDGLSPKELSKLIKSKRDMLKGYAKALDAIDKTKCKQIVAVADKDHDQKISYGEFYFALGKLQDGHFDRKEARAKAVSMMEKEQKERIASQRGVPMRTQHAKMFQRGMMFKHSQIGAPGASREENQRRAIAAAEAERARLISQQPQRGRHQTAKMIFTRSMKNNSRVGLSSKQRAGLTEEQIRAKNQKLALRAMENERAARAQEYRPRPQPHLRHQTTAALHQAWAGKTGLSKKERRGLTDEQIRRENQKLAMRAMDLQQKEYLLEQAREQDEIKATRISNQRRAVAMMESERNRILAEQVRDQEEERKIRLANQQRVAAMRAQVQHEHIHHMRAAQVHNHMARVQNQRKAKAMADHEHARRTHQWNQHDVHAHMQRQMRQRQAHADVTHEQARRTHQWNQHDVHAHMQRQMRQRQAHAAVTHEQARRTHDWNKHEHHTDVSREFNRRAVRKVRENAQREHIQAFHEAGGMKRGMSPVAKAVQGRF